MCNVSCDQCVQVTLGQRSYEIVIASQQLDQVAEAMNSWLVRRGYPRQGRAAVIITDRNVLESHAAIVSLSLRSAGWRCHTVGMDPGEQTKTLAAASHIYDVLVDLKADRQTVIVAVGGGVMGDLAGFVASTYNRGLPFVQVPTSLLAQVDSSVGGKVGINHPKGKNLIGAFHQPIGVYLDTSVLKTLPDREYRGGLAEVVKYGVILDAVFFEYLEQHVAELNEREGNALRHIVARSCRLKADIVEQDEFELTGVRAVLNYGHTFAHAFEALCGYGELSHGEAVSIGMLYASRLAERMGRIDAELTARQRRLLEALNIPTTLPATSRLNPDDVIDRMRLDKKAVGGQLRFVLPTRLGHVETVTDAPEAEVRAVLKEYLPVG